MPRRALRLTLLCLAASSAAGGEDDAAASAWLRESIRAAHEGKPLVDLLDAWSRCSRALPDNEYARAMAAHYEVFVADDAKFKRLDVAQVKDLPAERQAEYWIHELRDVAVLEYEGRYQPPMFLGWPEGNAVDRLVELGWDAIPLLIEHLDDPRPTRSARAFENGMFQTTYERLYAHGDLARLALRAITGRRFTTTHSGRLWWRGVRERGSAAFHLEILRRPGSANKGYAARRLVEEDRDANLPLVIESLGAVRTDEVRGILAAVEGAFDGSHRTLLAKHLESDDLLLVALAARLIRTRCDSDEGAGPLAVRLREAAASDSFFEGGEAMRALLVIDADRARALLLSLLADASPIVRRNALPWAAEVRYPEILDALLAQLADDAPEPSDAIRLRDLAAEAAARMLRYEKEFPHDEPVEARDAFVVELRRWIAKQGEIDWSKLRAGN